MAQQTLSKQEISTWLQLHLAPRLTLCWLEKRGYTLDDALSWCGAKATRLQHLGLHPETITALRQPPLAAIERSLACLKQPQHHLIPYNDPRYPPQLKEIHTPPLVLFVHGSPEVLQTTQIAIVGSRRPSPAGTRNCLSLARELARAGMTITSGLALGIDACAHHAALEAHAPTIAVAGTGLDTVYPGRHRALARNMTQQGGALVSEFVYGISAKPMHFPQRNRIISGLSLGVLVVEAAQKSGSLITAACACEQNRDVFAVPGSIQNPRASGCHRLIQSGAKLVCEANDLLAELALPASARNHSDHPTLPGLKPLNTQQKRLLERMGHDDPTTAEALVEQSGIPTAQVLALLSHLEMAGYVSQQNHLFTRLF